MAPNKPPEPAPESLNSPAPLQAMYSSSHRLASPPRHRYDRYPQPPAFPGSASHPHSPGYYTSSPQHNKIASPTTSRSEGEGNEELTTKGRKRKRLAKACSACHKNKRRCDGFAPCANCEFSSRPCLYINAQGEIIPPPRTREPKPKGSTVPLPRKEVEDNARVAPITQAEPKPERALQLVEGDNTLSAELIHLFFHNVHPYGAMFHMPTFHHRHYLSAVSPVLLYAIYAISAHVCSNPSFLNVFPPGTPPHARGLAFAEHADVLARQVLALRSSSEKQTADFVGSWEETEIVQALLLLSISIASQRASSYLDLANDVLCVGSAYPPPARREGTQIEYQTHDECRRRTFWLILIHRSGVPLRSHDMPLPGGEGEWERHGAVGKGREGLVPAKWPGEGEIGEMGHAIRILSILNDIQGASVANFPPLELRRNLLALEQDLKAWALSLPVELRFHEVSLSTALAQLHSPLHFVSRAGWLFAYMHCIAESAMYHLQVTLASTGERWTAERQDQAVDNIMVIMDAIGRQARSVPLMLGPLSVISDWHLASRNPKVDGLISKWWTEVAEDWGMDRTAVLSQKRRPGRIFTGVDVSSLGLYNTSPINRAPGSSISTTSSIGLQTPLFGLQYPQITIPSQHRSRSNTLKSYHTVRSRSRSPDAASWTEHKADARLPTLSTADLLRSGITTGISYFDLPKEAMRLSVSPINAPKTSPRFDPYATVRDSKATTSQTCAKSPEEKPDLMNKGSEPATGIEALVNAAQSARETTA